MVRHNGVVKNVYLMQCRNSWRFARRLSNAQSSTSNGFLQVRHSMTPMLKSICEEVHSRGGDEIIDKCTKFREPWNFNQYLFPDYAYLTKRASNSEMIAFKYHQLSWDFEMISHSISDGASHILCLNDGGNVGDFDQKSLQLQNVFGRKYGKKSRYEK